MIKEYLPKTDFLISRQHRHVSKETIHPWLPMLPQKIHKITIFFQHGCQFFTSLLLRYSPYCFGHPPDVFKCYAPGVTVAIGYKINSLLESTTKYCSVCHSSLQYRAHSENIVTKKLRRIRPQYGEFLRKLLVRVFNSSWKCEIINDLMSLQLKKNCKVNYFTASKLWCEGTWWFFSPVCRIHRLCSSVKASNVRSWSQGAVAKGYLMKSTK